MKHGRSRRNQPKRASHRDVAPKRSPNDVTERGSRFRFQPDVCRHNSLSLAEPVGGEKIPPAAAAVLFRWGSYDTAVHHGRRHAFCFLFVFLFHEGKRCGGKVPIPFHIPVFVIVQGLLILLINFSRFLSASLRRWARGLAVFA